MLFFQSTVSVFSTFLQFTRFSYVISVATMMAMTTDNFCVSKVRWFSDFYGHRFYVHFQFLDFLSLCQQLLSKFSRLVKPESYVKTNTVSLSLASLAESIAFAVHAQPRIRDEKKTYEDNADDMKNH